MRATEKSLIDGNRYLLRFDGDAEIESLIGPTKVRVAGEAVFCVRGEGPGRRGLVLERLGLGASSIETPKAPTGTITVLAEAAEGMLSFGGRRDKWVIDAPAKIHYPPLDDRDDKPDRGCYYMPRFLPAGIRLEGTLAGLEGESPHGKLRLAVACAAGEDEAFTSLVVVRDFEWLPMVPLRGTANHPCPEGHEVNRRRLTVQPVGFRTSVNDPAPSASTAAAQLATAQAIWDKCCIDIEVRPTEMITNGVLKTSSDIPGIKAAYTDPDPNVIEIFFVQNALPLIGGGTACAIGVASQKLVIAEPNNGNPVLVAHEIGHALGLLHPLSSDPGSVMAPTGSAMNPGTDLVSHAMCEAISQPALQTLSETCCLHHDIGNHFIRDFPEDIGNEPSVPLPPGRTRYSMSNVWNRVTNTPGTFGGNGPDHEHPFRFESDGTTPKTNYLHARVEQAGVMRITGSEVRFYIKNPGSGPGNLTFLGAANVPAGSLPQDAVLPWTVPAGLPNHSCVFAAAHSPAEPAQDPTSLGWAAAETLSRDDNDWAQRNLNIREVSPNNAGNTFVAPPFLVRRPAEVDDKLVLRVDTRAARGLEALTLHLGDDEVREITIGKVTRFEVPAARLVPISLRGTIDKRAKEGSTYAIQIDPKLGDVELVGYGTTFRVAARRGYLLQLNDTLLAAADDLARILDLEAGHRIAEVWREQAVGECPVTAVSAKTAIQLAEIVYDVSKALGRRKLARLAGLGEQTETFLKAVETGEEDAIVETLFAVAQTWQLVVWSVKER